MSNERSHPFIDRREALALFDLVRGRRPREPWPLLPLLAFIGPGGSGKSRLIEHLRTTTCRFGEGRSVLPHASLDFTLLDAPKNLLDIFIALRDELHGKVDGDGKRLHFPRFDLGASIAAAYATDGALASPSLGELRSHLTQAQAVFTSIGEMGNALGNLVPVIPPLITGIKSAAHFPPLRALVQHLQSGPGWRWYREHGSMLGLRAGDGIEQVLLRLHEMSVPGTSQRETLVEELLPVAFLDDLYEALIGQGATKAFSTTANVILFLDGYEALMDTSRELALRLLHLLVCNERRRRGETDPLLVVVGSRDRLLDHPDAERYAEQHPPFEVPAASVEEEARAWACVRYQEWAKRLPLQTQVLRLQDLYLPVFLRDFDAHGARSLFFQLARSRDLEARFTATHSEQLAQAIHRVTRGHPLFVTLAAEAVFEAELRGEPLSPAEFDRALVSPRRAEDTRIGDYLLDLYLKQLSKAERKQLIFSAIPRSVSVEVLKVAVPLPTELDAQEYWERYRRYTFFRAIDHERLVLHHLVRKLLLERVPEGDYTDIHTRLYRHFARRHQRGDEAAGIEEAYHAMALGNPQPAITLGVQAQQEGSTP